jgi:uncharacterized protein
MSLKRRILIAVACIVLLILAVVGYRVAHLIFPNAWLPKTADHFQQQSDRRFVDPHTYDSEWFDAARAGRQDISQALLQAGYPVNAQSDAGHTALILATYHGQFDEVAMLIQAGADPCLADHNGNTALMGALFKGELAIAEQLLGHCPVDQTNNAGQTALSFAALFGRLEFIPRLAAMGADSQHVDAKGATALDIVEQQRNTEAVAALRAVGAR